MTLDNKIFNWLIERINIHALRGELYSGTLQYITWDPSYEEWKLCSFEEKIISWLDVLIKNLKKERKMDNNIQEPLIEKDEIEELLEELEHLLSENEKNGHTVSISEEEIEEWMERDYEEDLDIKIKSGKPLKELTIGERNAIALRDYYEGFRMVLRDSKYPTEEEWEILLGDDEERKEEYWKSRRTTSSKDN
ncbi:MAG TPA: hypothetical protein VHA52_10060 [Candidatus Babeliaceae bacterium]|nr:hypothetical protein [Candidatus Babeliaceae bacterium]